MNLADFILLANIHIKGAIKLAINKYISTLSANPTKWSNTLKQFVGKLPTNCLSVFGHFVKLTLKGLASNLVFSTVKYLFILLTHFSTMSHFYSPWKHQEKYTRATAHRFFLWYRNKGLAFILLTKINHCSQVKTKVNFIKFRIRWYQTMILDIYIFCKRKIPRTGDRKIWF